ncbi:MAG: tetratricopeptide repeat protein [Acidimicrobiales bacterium]
MALATLEALAADDFRQAEVLLRLGLARALAGDHPVAERAWLAAERLAPASAAASTNLAEAYARAGRWEEAQAAARRALSPDPGDQRALDGLAADDGS